MEIGGDTTKLTKALSGVNKSISQTQTALKDVRQLAIPSTRRVSLRICLFVPGKLLGPNTQPRVKFLFGKGAFGVVMGKPFGSHG